jgi:hypothetical protein
MGAAMGRAYRSHLLHIDISPWTTLHLASVIARWHPMDEDDTKMASRSANFETHKSDQTNYSAFLRNADGLLVCRMSKKNVCDVAERVRWSFVRWLVDDEARRRSMVLALLA